MPAFNSEKYIEEAVTSVLNQDHSNWELIIVDDGSTDNTLNILRDLSDTRIRIFECEHKGVSSARNTALAHCSGQYICLLDSDDVLPSYSISSRANILDLNPLLQFVDGNVVVFNSDMKKELTRFSPSFRGKVQNELIRFRSSCFFGPTWMIRKLPNKEYHFREDITHGEDLHFYLSISEDGSYSYTDEIVLNYRKHASSAMTNIKGMENGLFSFLQAARQCSNSSFTSRWELKYRLTRAVTGTYVHNGKILSAIRSFIKFLTN